MKTLLRYRPTGVLIEAVLIEAVLIAALVTFFPALSLACPDVLGLTDTNCDQTVKIFLTGDSISRGVGDNKAIGYTGRLEQSFGSPQFKALNIGVPGTDPARLQREFVRNIDRGRSTTRAVADADYGMIQVGTNSYWTGDKPFQVVMKILRLKKYLERAIEERYGTRPVIFVAKIPLTERAYQNPFIREVNRELDRKKRTLNLYVNFESIPVSRLGIEDTLHPGASGYRIMSRRILKALKRKVQKKAQRTYQDIDGDGVYDQAEVGRFLTDPNLSDSDLDGLSDGEEILNYKTNPKSKDSDADTVEDRAEILNGTDPLDSSSR